MVSSSASDWKSHYLDHPDNEAINQQMEKVLSFCHYDLSNEACMKNLKDNPGLAFLGVDIFNDLFLFHRVRLVAGALDALDETRDHLPHVVLPAQVDRDDPGQLGSAARLKRFLAGGRTSAEVVARANHASLVGCRPEASRAVWVQVRVGGPRWFGQGLDPTAEARAGPA